MAKKRDNLYDILTMWSVIEHFENPAQEMQYVNRLLKMGGIVCVWTGDIDSIYSKLFGRHWGYLIGQHIQFFSKNSLKKLMQASGFELVYQGVYPYVLSFQYLVVHLTKYPIMGNIAKKIVSWFHLEEQCLTIKTSDQMLAMYKKIENV